MASLRGKIPHFLGISLSLPAVKMVASTIVTQSPWLHFLIGVVSEGRIGTRSPLSLSLVAFVIS